MTRTVWIRYISRVLVMIWAAWWTFFGVASAIAKGSNPVEILCYATFPGLLFLVSAIIAWRWQIIGGIILVLVGLFLFVVYPIKYSHFSFCMILSVLAALALPPLVAGVLFLASR